MDFPEKHYYSVNKRILSIIGQWPHQSIWEKRLLRIAVALFILSILVPEVIKLCDEWGVDKDAVFESIPPLGLHAINFIKLTNCTINMDKMKTLLVHMESDWRSRDKGSGRDILRHYAERGRAITVGYVLYMYVSAFLYVCLPLIPLFLDVVKPLNESRPLEFLFRTEYYIDQDKYFFPIFLHALTTTFMSITIVLAFDTMYGAYIQYACSIFAELSQQLEICVKNVDASHVDLNVYKDDDHTYHNIVKCIKKQKEVVKFFNILESAYSIYFLFIIGISILLMSFTGVQTVMKMGEFELAMRYGSFTLGQIVHIFFACWHGQMLTDHSLRINESVYNSIWYNSSFQSRRLVMLIMMKSAYPCQLSAWNLFFISLETFSKVLRTSMSYFTVLTSLR